MADINLEQIVMSKIIEGINGMDSEKESTVIIHNFFDSDSLWLGLFVSEKEKGKGILIDSFVWMNEDVKLISQRRLHCIIDNESKLNMPTFDWYVFNSLVAEISYVISAFYNDMNNIQ